jgi:glycosyltransferase involved in cell wall biosynthesis
MIVDIILRSHDGGDVHPDIGRFLSVAKKEIVKRSVRSLHESSKLVGEHVISFHIIDDHSSDETVAVLKEIAEVEPLSGTGNNASWLRAFKCARDSAADVVYLVEDDYLHAPEALREMFHFYQFAKERSGDKEIVLCPYDDFFNYVYGPDKVGFVVPGRERHWRTNTYTMGTFLISPQIVREHFEKFEQLARLYETPQGIAGGVTEETTIARIWKEGFATLFTPLPSLAVHLNQNEPPLFDWKTLWEKYA